MGTDDASWDPAANDRFFQLPELPIPQLSSEFFDEVAASSAAGITGAALQQALYGTGFSSMAGAVASSASEGPLSCSSGSYGDGCFMAAEPPQPTLGPPLRHSLHYAPSPLLPPRVLTMEEPAAASHASLRSGLRRPLQSDVGKEAAEKTRHGAGEGPEEMHSDDALSHEEESHGSEKRARRDHATADEKVRANRDRNREHARNTRLRKKAYVEKLKLTVEQLGAERDRSERDRSVSATSMIEQQAHRKQVLQTLFFYRARGERDRDLWAALLDESFTCVMPITPYRSFPPYEVVNNQRVVIGIDAFIQDVSSLRVLTDSIAQDRRSGKRVCVQYYAGPQDTIIVGESVMCRWMMKTENAAQCGALSECFNHGMLKARFSPQNRLSHLELVFDVMSFMQQLQRASGQEDFRVVPNTPAMAQAPALEARVVMDAVAPYAITYANEAFAALSGYAPAEVTGRTLAVLQGAETDKMVLGDFLKEIEAQRPASMDITNYTKDGRRFVNYVRAFPLGTDGRITHYLAVLEDAGEPLPPQAAAAASAAAVGDLQGMTDLG